MHSKAGWLGTPHTLCCPPSGDANGVRVPWAAHYTLSSINQSSDGTGARAGEVSEAAAVKARWLGNFCPRQPVHRALKRQQQPRPLSAAPGSSALIRPGPAREFKTTSSGPLWSAPVRPACSKQHAPVRVLRSLTGDGPPVRFIDPAPGRPATSAPSHRCAGFYGPQSAGPRSGVQVTSSGSSAPLRPGPPASSNDLSQGSTPRSRDGPLGQVHRPRTGSAC